MSNEAAVDGAIEPDTEKAAPTGGVQRLYSFDNGYGASVIRSGMSYGGESGLWELAVLDRAGRLTYDTPITDDVLGYLTEDDVQAHLRAIRDLPAAQS